MVPRRDEAFGAVPDEVLSAGQAQGLIDNIIIGRVLILHQGPLHLFLFRPAGDVDFFTRQGIEACIVHGRRQAARRRDEVLYLFRLHMHIPQEFGQGDGIFQGTAGMAGHEIRDEVLFLPSSRLASSNQSLNFRKAWTSALPMRSVTCLTTCSGATFSWPLT